MQGMRAERPLDNEQHTSASDVAIDCWVHPKTIAVM